MLVPITLATILSYVDWRALPHVDRASAIRTAAAAAATYSGLLRAPKNGIAIEVPSGGPAMPRTAQSIDSWAAIPVWPAWPTPTSPTGGRVRPISPPPDFADPFLLLAHHRHSFSPGDPLRGPFKTLGGALGLPYVGDEGFKMVSSLLLLLHLLLTSSSRLFSPPPLTSSRLSILIAASTSGRSCSRGPTASGTRTRSAASASTAAARASSCAAAREPCTRSSGRRVPTVTHPGLELAVCQRAAATAALLSRS